MTNEFDPRHAAPSTRLAILLAGILACSHLQASEFFISDNAAGTGTGDAAANASGYEFFNTPANWSAVAGSSGKISPGDTVHLVGIITHQLIVLGNGTRGTPITILFDPGTKMSAPSWPGNKRNSGAGAISIDERDYITIDGGATGLIGGTSGAGIPNGVIECTGNGTDLEMKVDSVGVCGTSCSHFVVKNLVFRNLYVRSRGAEANNFGVGVSDTAKDNAPYAEVRVTNCVFSDMYQGVDLDYPSAGARNVEMDHCTVRRANWGGRIGDRDKRSFFGGYLKVHDNWFCDFTNWDDTSPANNWHHNGFYAWNEQGGESSFTARAEFYNNTIGPHFYVGSGVNHATSGIYLSGSGMRAGLLIYNNLFLEDPGDHPSNGDIYLLPGDGFIGRILNNTFAGGDAGIAINIDGGRGGKQVLEVENNIVTEKTFISVFDSSAVTIFSDYNDAFRLLPGQEFSSSMNGSSIFRSPAQWRGMGNEKHGSDRDPHLNTEHMPEPPSGAIDSGSNFQVYFTSDKDGRTRPLGAGWDMGAFEFDPAVLPRK